MPTVLSTQILPPISSTRRLLMETPSPFAPNGLFMLFLSCCAGVLGYEAIKLYTDDFKKTVKGKTDA